MKKITKNWVIGFINGEGCFTFINGNPIFQVGLNERDNGILEELKDFFGMGKIQINTYPNSPRTFKIYGKEDCSELFKIFDGKLLGQKARDFEIWKELIESGIKPKMGIKMLREIEKEI